MRHVSPERFAARELSAADQAHTEACATCQQARQRVQGARGTMSELAAVTPPPLNWDLLGARLYWSASSEVRRREREREGRQQRGWLRRLVPVALAGVAFGAATAGVLVVRAHKQLAVDKVTPVRAVPVVLPPAPAEAPVLAVAEPHAPLGGIITFLQGDVTINGHAATPDTQIGPGAILVTEGGRVTVQFGDRSGFQLEPKSRAELLAFDSQAVEVKITGAIDVELSKRHAGERFVVHAGARSVEVRGTIFRVDEDERAARLDVAVERGRVAVLEGADSVEISAGSRLALRSTEALAGVKPRAFTDSETVILARSMHVPLLPVRAGSPWSGEAALGGSALLLVQASPRADVRIDGEAAGTGSFVLRAPPGRHLVESGHGASRWVEVEAGDRARAEVAAEAKETGSSERPAQVDAQLEAQRAQITHCGDSMRKIDPSFQGEIRVEIGVGADGSVSSVASVRTLVDGQGEARRGPPAEGLSPQTETCVLDVIRDRFTFPAGTKATVQKNIRF